MRRLRLGGKQLFHLKMSNGSNFVACLTRDDGNMPNFEGWPFHEQVSEVTFEAAVYELLRSEP